VFILSNQVKSLARWRPFPSSYRFIRLRIPVTMTLSTVRHINEISYRHVAQNNHLSDKKVPGVQRGPVLKMQQNWRTTYQNGAGYVTSCVLWDKTTVFYTCSCYLRCNFLIATHLTLTQWVYTEQNAYNEVKRMESWPQTSQAKASRVVRYSFFWDTTLRQWVLCSRNFEATQWLWMKYALF
jgi:hypothetical protein